MTEANIQASPLALGQSMSSPPLILQKLNRRLKKRKAAEWRFRWYGRVAITVSAVFLLMVFSSVIRDGLPAFMTYYLFLEVPLKAETLGIEPENGLYTTKVLAEGDYSAALKAALRAKFPEIKDRQAQQALYQMMSVHAEYALQDQVMAKPDLIGTTLPIWVLAGDRVNLLLKGYVARDTPEADRRISNAQIEWIDALVQKGHIERRFNIAFFTLGDSRQAEAAGILGALKGSFYVMVVTLLLAFPLGVGAAIYLEEFAPRNWLTDFIEVNINNLAAVPSIVFGLLGLAVFINIFGMPRSAPIVGGMVLALVTLPTIIISSRAALKSVPPSIKEAALGVGASPMQAMFHHTLPLAMPGMLTGMIIGMAHALGETAPLLMIGMVAFIVDIPKGIFDSATVLPVQIYLWADNPERAFVEKTAAAILVLLVFLITMNALAVILRRHFERRW